MPALDVQHLLARLYTDESLLAQFLLDRDKFCRRLESGDADFVKQIDGRQLEFFAESLRSKRAREAQSLLPMTAAALGQKFYEEFFDYSSGSIPSGAKKRVADAMAFCRHLLDARRDADDIAEDLALDAARFELFSFELHFKLRCEGKQPVICHATARRWPLFRLKRFAHALPAMAKGSDVRGSDVRGAARKQTIAAFVNVPGLRGIWYW